MIPPLSGAIALEKLTTEQARWVQERLIFGGYLRQNDADGIVGPRTMGAFNRWKEDANLGQLGIIGPGSVALLDQLDEKNPVSEQQTGMIQRININAGDRTGRRAVLPVVGEVFSNQWIDSDYPFFTWGELTKDLTRIPSKESEVENAFKLIAAIGLVRKEHNKIWRVTSGFRPAHINRAVGGARNSTHIYFRGIDVASDDLPGMLAIARKTSAIKGIGLGQRRGFLHFDIGWSDRDRRREFGY